MTKPNDDSLPLAGAILPSLDPEIILRGAILQGTDISWSNPKGILYPEGILGGAILPEQSRPQDEPYDEFGVLPLGDGRGGR